MADVWILLEIASFHAAERFVLGVGVEIVRGFRPVRVKDIEKKRPSLPLGDRFEPLDSRLKEDTMEPPVVAILAACPLVGESLFVRRQRFVDCHLVALLCVFEWGCQLLAGRSFHSPLSFAFLSLDLFSVVLE